MNLYLIRHTSVDVSPGICYGQSDVGVAASFQSEKEKVKSEIDGLCFDVVFSSPLFRCKTFAESQIQKENIIFDERLKELNFGDWELLPWLSISGEYADKWFKDYINTPSPNGESLKDVVIRVGSFLEEIKKSESKSILCFTHSGPIRVFEHLINNVTIQELFELEVDYAGVYSYTI